MLDAARSLQLGQLAAEVALGDEQSISGACHSHRHHKDRGHCCLNIDDVCLIC